MNKRFTQYLSIFLLTMGISTQSVQLSSSDWTTVGEGIAYREYRLPGPNRVFVARMDRRNPNVILESSIAQGTLSGGKETVSGMAIRYDQAINTWNDEGISYPQGVIPIGAMVGWQVQNDQAWGARNKVIVAINGSFHDTETGVPSGGMIHSGWYAKPFNDLGGGSGFAWKRNRSAFIGECVNHRPEKQILQNLTTGKTQEILNINFRFRGGRFLIYTPQFDDSSHSEIRGVEVLIELKQPLGILPLPAMTYGIVREIHDQKDPIHIPFDHIVIWARGPAKQNLLRTVHVGDLVGLSLEISPYDADCNTPQSLDWTKTYASIGGSYYFLKDGVVQDFDDLGAIRQNPRTAICFNGQSIYFVVVDGRRNEYSKGMSIAELASFCKDTLGAEWGINQDGGGSSTMWINGEVMNSPSDGHEREVANGMMMVNVEPMERSTTFKVGDLVKTQRATDLRLGPGDNYEMIHSLKNKDEGVILHHTNNLNGVLAKGTYWWKVDFGGEVGWVDETDLVLVNRTLHLLVDNRLQP